MDKNRKRNCKCLGRYNVTLDHMKKVLGDVKKTMNVFAEKVLDKLESIDGKLSHTTNLKQEADRRLF